MAAVAKTLGMVDQPLLSWFKVHQQGKPIGADSSPVSAEQIGRSRLHAELARVTTGRDILGVAPAYAATAAK